MTKRVPVSKRALLARLNRQLDKCVVKVARGRAREIFGDYYIIDKDGQPSAINLEQFAREAGVLKPYEEMVGD